MAGELEGLDEAQQPDDGKEPQQPGTEYVGAHPYRLKDPGGFVLVKPATEKTTETETRLTNFGALITADVAIDDGAEVRREFEISASVNGRSARFTVPAERFAGMGWVTEHLGAGAIVRAGMGLKDHARAAIQYLSSNISERHVYAHTGWRQLPGGWGYLTASGAMTASGLDASVTVDIGPLSGFSLPDVPDLPALREAILASLAILEIAPDQVTVPLLGAVYRAPVPLPADCSGWLYGKSGTFKTNLTALGQQHYGPTMREGALPGNWTSTANTLEEQAFQLDGALFVVDDYSPDASRFEAQKRAAAADRLMRGAANHSARGRMRPDGTLRPPKPVRAQVLTSAEDLPPAGVSLRARVMISEVGKGAVNLTRLTAAQAAADDGTLAMAMAGYVKHLAARLDKEPDLRAALKARLFKLRDVARSQGHPRTALNIASYALGWDEWLAYAERAGAITQARSEQLWRRAWKALCDLGADQGRYARDAEPEMVYLRALGSLIAAGRAHLAGPDGGSPAQAERYGWRFREQAVSGTWHGQRYGIWEPQGERLGWTDGENIYLDPDGSHKAARQFAEASGQPLGQSKHMLHKLLAERRLLASRSDPGHFTAKRDLDGKTGRRVLHLTVRGFDSAET